MSRPDPHYAGAKTQAEADAILARFTLPPTWRLTTAPIRTFAFRSKWGLALWHGDALELKWAVYDLGGACYIAQAHAERESRAVVVTTDMDGWIRSIDEAV